jgi:2-polyprenyl-3-methyl-5-hydroxy-6-metoxy-1,4-benzoquinol methylase
VQQDWFDTNRRMWDERVPIHVRGDFYDVDAFRKGGTVLRDFEKEDVGDVRGLELVHLQCHFGLDTLSWARLGATVTGLDFSEPAIEAARELARSIDLDATFVPGNVYDAPGILERTFDVVYTGLGALNWLPDLDRWAEVVHALVRPGGMAYIAEFHPITDVFADEDLSVVRPYFHGETPTEWNDPGTYADPSAPTRHDRTFEWTHPVSVVIQALLDQGLVLERFREHDFTLFARWPWLELTGRDTYRLPEGTPSLPLMYSIRLRRPARA